MSRIGMKPITILDGVQVDLGKNNNINVKGPLGTLTATMHKDMKITIDNGIITVERPSDKKVHKALHGLTRSLINNMVMGVSVAFIKQLEINGVGYRAQLKGDTLVLVLGYSHQIEMKIPEGISIEVPTQTQITVKGCDKQAVGQFAAQIREKRRPEPYKGKGIKYVGEKIIRKEGKAGAAR